MPIVTKKTVNDEIPKSRITLTYRTEVNGEPEDVTLPFRVLVLGDLSCGTSSKRSADLDGRRIRNLDPDGKNLQAIMADMGMNLSVTVPNCISSSGGNITALLRIDSMKSFSPAEVAKQVPNIKALLQLKTLLLEAQANLDNNKDFRKLIRELAKSEGAVGALRQELGAPYQGFALPPEPARGSSASAGDDAEAKAGGQSGGSSGGAAGGASGAAGGGGPSGASSVPSGAAPVPSQASASQPSANQASASQASSASGGSQGGPAAGLGHEFTERIRYIMAEAQTTLTPNLASFLKTAKADAAPARNAGPLIKGNLEDVAPEETADRFLSTLAAVVYNMNPTERKFDKENIQKLIERVDKLVNAQLQAILHEDRFRQLESTWRSIDDLVQNTNFRANITISLLDVTKEELHDDLELNLADVAGSELFKKVYVQEYDQFGGAPYGVMIGLYDFDQSEKDVTWLRGIAKVAAASHAPFIGNVSPSFFSCAKMADVEQLRDISGLLATPRYNKWNSFREADSNEPAYVGLTLPRYMVRPPYHDETYPAESISFNEDVKGDDHEAYLWGHSSILFARNLVKSFETSGWCQHIRGVKGGGMLKNLASHVYKIRGESELKAPVEISMPDFREFELANAGLIPLIHKKGTSDAVFFSAQALKKPLRFKDPKDSENSQLTTNLAYTFSISRIAHYLKCIMRDNIGSTANGAYIYSQIDRWISGYVTTLVNPDDLTLRYYPFKAYALEVTDVPGKVGWYHCNLSILPHVQFEGLDVDLRVDARLNK